MFNKILKGESILVLSAIIHGFFAIFINDMVKAIPPILLAGISSLIPGIVLFFYILCSKKKFKNIFAKEKIKYLLGVVLFIVVLPSIFIFIGTGYTSSINTSILLQSELIFTFLACTIFFGEKATFGKFFATLFVFLGTFIVLFKGNLALDKGALLICIGTAFYPLGNFCQKKLLKVLDEYSLLFFRSFFGGIFLIIISLLTEDISGAVLLNLKENFIYIVLASLSIFLVAKIFWFKGLKLIDISKAMPIVLSAPIFTLLFAYFINGEIPSLYQLIGVLFTLIGIVFVF